MDKVLLPIIVVLAVTVVQFSIQRNVTRRYDYRCANCGATFALPPLTATIAPHRLGGLKLVRCPTCRARTWASPVPKDGSRTSR